MLIDTLKKGFLSGLKSCWFLTRIIIPVYIAITIVKHTPVMNWLISIFEPIMGIFHLPGEAAVPWITGIFLDEYSCIAGIKAVGLSGFAVTIIALMNLFAHSLFIEAAVLKKMEMSITFFTLYRMITAIVIGILFGWLGVIFQLW